MITEYPVVSDPDDYAPSGVLIDGEPPVAKSRGWGNLAGWSESEMNKRGPLTGCWHASMFTCGQV
jgi:hypothetical protein